MGSNSIKAKYVGKIFGRKLDNIRGKFRTLHNDNLRNS